MNTYLYIMELIFIEISGKLVCDYDTLPNDNNGRSLVMEMCFIFFKSYRKRLAGMFSYGEFYWSFF